MNAATPAPAAKAWSFSPGWLAAYLVVIALVVGGVFYGRWRTFQIYGSAGAQASWSEWRQDVEEAQAEGPVRRRIPKSAEPPALVLMRDYFAICLAAAVFFTSILFGTLMIFIRGAMQPGPTIRHDR